MKVLFATLLIVGFAAATPCPVLEKLKTQLQKGVEDVKSHIKESVDETSTLAKADIPSFIRNPITGSANFIKNLSNAARNVVVKCISDVEKLNRNIKTTTSELKKVDPKLVNQKVYSVLDNLVQKIIQNVKNARNSVMEHLKRVIRQVSDDAKTLMTNPGVGAKMQEKWEKEIDELTSDGNKYAALMEKEIQDALNEIETLYPPTPKEIVKKLRTNLELDVKGVDTNIKQLLKRSADNDKNKVDVFIQDPPKGSGPLVNDLFNDARDVLLASYSDIEKMSENIRKATDELKKVDAASPLASDLDSLLTELRGIRTAAKDNVISNLGKAVTQVATDMEKLGTASADEKKKMKDDWNAHFAEFVVALNNYVTKIQDTVQKSLGAMEKKVEQ